MHRGVAAAGVGAEEYGAEQSHRTCASTASRSPRRFRDGAAKFDLCTVIRVARSRGFTARLWFWCVNKAGRPLVAAANVDGELAVFVGNLRQSSDFRLALRFLVQPSEMRRAVMARRSDLAVVRFLFSRRLGVSLAPRETQPEIFSHVCRYD